MARAVRTVLSEGMLAGFIGYLVIVVAMALGDVLRGGALLQTPALLGSALFYGLDDPAGLRVWAGPVLAYNGVHLVLLLVLGTFMAWLASLAERGPQFWYLTLVALLFVLLHALVLPLWLPAGVRAAISPWAAAVATGLAVLAMGWYLWRAHPRLRRHLRTDPA